MQTATLAPRRMTPPAAPADPIWALLLAAGPAGASREEIADAIFPAGQRPARWETALYERLRLLRRPAARAGRRLERLAGARPTRWHIARVDEPEDAPPPVATFTALKRVARTAPPVKRVARTAAPPVVAPIAPALADAVPSLVFTGAAQAHLDLKRCSCRWPLGEPNAEDFRFCCEAVWAEGKSYCRDHARQARGAAERQARVA